MLNIRFFYSIEKDKLIRYKKLLPKVLYNLMIYVRENVSFSVREWWIHFLYLSWTPHIVVRPFASASSRGKGTNIFTAANLVICSRRVHSQCGSADSISRQPRSCLLALCLVDDNRAYPPLGFTRRMSRLRI